MNTTATIGANSQDKYIVYYEASNGERFDFYECRDLLNVRSFKAFPHTKEGELRKCCVAQVDWVCDLPELVEKFLIAEQKRKEEQAENADPEFEAFKKGKRDAIANGSRDTNWLTNASELEVDAYNYAFDKNLS